MSTRKGTLTLTKETRGWSTADGRPVDVEPGTYEVTNRIHDTQGRRIEVMVPGSDEIAFDLIGPADAAATQGYAVDEDELRAERDAAIRHAVGNLEMLGVPAEAMISLYDWMAANVQEVRS